jgi:hypothetical protein
LPLIVAELPKSDLFQNCRRTRNPHPKNCITPFLPEQNRLYHQWRLTGDHHWTSRFSSGNLED